MIFSHILGFFKQFPAKRIVIIVLMLVTAQLIFALTPVARWDVVPHQRIDQGEVFNIGVVAFSKAGISNVTFSVSGQGYNGPNSQIANSMTHNPRTDVYEYWVPIRSSDFSSDGVITVSATVNGNDGGTRVLDTISLLVNATGNLPQPKAWVSPSGSDSTGVVGNESRPFRTIARAILAIQSVNVGKADGGIVYLDEGEYELGSGTVSTRDEWLTITKDSNADNTKVIIHGGGGPGSITETDLIRIYSITLRSDGYNDAFLRGYPGPEPLWLWVDKCLIIGSGRHVSISSPAMRDDNWFCTNSYIFDVDNALRHTDLGRNVEIEHIGDDACVNCDMVINIKLTDQDPGNTYWHADGWQNHGAPMENKIVYGYYGKDMHYQGIFCRNESGVGKHKNNAFVNVFMEMREPGRYGYNGDNTLNLENCHIYGQWDHLIFWHCTLPTEDTSLFNELEGGIGFNMENCSFIGNVFFEFIDFIGKDHTEEWPYGLPGNPYNNEFLYNHYTWSYIDQGDLGRHPQVWSKSPDSSADGTQSLGDPKLNLDNPEDISFGEPFQTSPLVNRIQFPIVPVDALGNLRDSSPDIGAIEMKGLGSPSPPPESPRGLRIH